MTDSYQDFLRQKDFRREPSGFEPLFMPECLFPFQRHLVDWAVRLGKGALLEDCGLGKLHPVTEPVLTPNGWKPIGDVRVGDALIGSNGKPTVVLALYPQGKKEIVRVEFSDGAYSRCGWEHLWSVKSQNDRTRDKKYRTMTTREILDSGLRYGKKRNSRQWSVPLAAPICSLADEVCLIDPYTLGVILGDGSINDRGYVSFTTDKEIILSLGIEGNLKTHYRTEWVGKLNTSSFMKELKTYGLNGKGSHEKFVPGCYLRFDAGSRLALLQGLMDTDGHALSEGGTEFSSTSENLIDSVVSLARSLGGIANKKGPRITTYDYKGEKKEGKESWRVNVRLPATMIPFRVKRKASSYVIPTKYQPTRFIDQVIPENKKEESVCLLVDATDHLYVTRDYVLTHNSVQELAYAENLVRKFNKPVLILAPLAVSRQFVSEGEKFGISCKQTQEGKVYKGINVTNYERLKNFSPSDFCGVIADESGCLKNSDSKTRKQVTAFMSRIEYRLLGTATPAPNDYMELGTSSEALGNMSRNQMLAMFFTNDGEQTQKWNLKGHAKSRFWKWVATWARAIRKPSDFGFDDEGFVLPPLKIHHHAAPSQVPGDGLLFQPYAKTLEEQREENKRTLRTRCEKVASLIPNKGAALIWVNLNPEGNLITDLIPDAVEVVGSDRDEAKEERLLAFVNGQIRVLVTKAKIAGFGLNFQHCSNVVYLPSYSAEAYYQAIRRCWRFGQKKEVNCHLVYSEGNQNVVTSMLKKEQQSIVMYQSVVREMRSVLQAAEKDKRQDVRIPEWLR